MVAKQFILFLLHNAPAGELRVNAGVVWLADDTVWSTPERIFRGEVLTTMRYTNRRLPLPLQHNFWQLSMCRPLTSAAPGDRPVGPHPSLRHWKQSNRELFNNTVQGLYHKSKTFHHVILRHIKVGQWSSCGRDIKYTSQPWQSSQQLSNRYENKDDSCHQQRRRAYDGRAWREAFDLQRIITPFTSAVARFAGR